MMSRSLIHQHEIVNQGLSAEAPEPDGPLQSMPLFQDPELRDMLRRALRFSTQQASLQLYHRWFIDNTKTGGLLFLSPDSEVSADLAEMILDHVVHVVEVPLPIGRNLMRKNVAEWLADQLPLWQDSGTLDGKLCGETRDTLRRR